MTSINNIYTFIISIRDNIHFDRTVLEQGKDIIVAKTYLSNVDLSFCLCLSINLSNSDQYILLSEF